MHKCSVLIRVVNVSQGDEKVAEEYSGKREDSEHWAAELWIPVPQAGYDQENFTQHLSIVPHSSWSEFYCTVCYLASISVRRGMRQEKKKKNSALSIYPAQPHDEIISAAISWN